MRLDDMSLEAPGRGRTPPQQGPGGTGGAADAGVGVGSAVGQRVAEAASADEAVGRVRELVAGLVEGAGVGAR